MNLGMENKKMRRKKCLIQAILTVLLLVGTFEQLSALVIEKEVSWTRLLEGVFIYNVRNHHRTDYPITINGIELKKGEDYEFIITDPGLTWFDHTGTTWKLTLRNRIYKDYWWQPSQLKIRLEKTRGFFSPFSREKETIFIISIIDECPELTKIIYQEFEDIFIPKGPGAIEKYTGIQVNWETLLQALRGGDLKCRIEELPEFAEPGSIRAECYKNYWFLKFLKGTHSGESWGFATGEYTLPPSVRFFLETLGDALLQIHRDRFYHSRIKEISIRCTGYADYLHYNGSRDVENLNIYYHADACPGDIQLSDKDAFVYLGNGNHQNGLTRIISIKDNCTLSAARGYIAMDYLSDYICKQIEKQGMTGNLNISYWYKAGGIILPQARKENEGFDGVPENRRIEIDITIDAANRNQGSEQ